MRATFRVTIREIYARSGRVSTCPKVLRRMAYQRMMRSSIFEAFEGGVAASATPTVIRNVPRSVGVPLSSPLAERRTPIGSGPATSENVYGGVPPLARIDAL